MAKMLEVTLKKSAIGGTKGQRETLKGLGLKKLHKTRYLEDTSCVRGMINKVSHLVEWKEVSGK